MNRPSLSALLFAVAATASSVLLSAAPAAAAPPDVDEFSVSFPDSCPGVEDPLLTTLDIRRTTKVQPDGTVHFWLDIHGRITNQASGEYVRVHATRRFFDDAAADRSRFAGLQNTFSAPGHGVLALNAGWASGLLSQPLSTYELRGRWDGLEGTLPPAVCDVLD